MSLSASELSQIPLSVKLQPRPQPGALFWRETFYMAIIESISQEDLQPTVKLCVGGLQSSSIAVKRSATAKLRLLAKNRADNRALIGETGAVPAPIPLLNYSDPTTEEHAVTALLNLSLNDGNKSVLTRARAVKSLIYVLKTGTEASKHNAACTLLSLALVDEYKLSIGECGAIPPLVALLINGSVRGKKDVLTTLYKLCSVSLNKERAVRASVGIPNFSRYLVIHNWGGRGLTESGIRESCEALKLAGDVVGAELGE